MDDALALVSGFLELRPNVNDFRNGEKTPNSFQTDLPLPS